MRPRDPMKIEALFDATLRVCGDQGLAGLTVPAIVKEAGLSVGSFYVYFDSKESLMKELYLRTKASSGAEMLKGVDLGEPVRAVFRKLCYNYFHHRVEERLVSHFQEQYYASPYPDGEVRESSDATFRPFLDLLERGRREELVKKTQPMVLMRFCLAVLREAATTVMPGDIREGQALIETAIAFCWDGIKR